LTAALADRRADLVAAVAMARADLGRWIDGAQAVEPAGDPPGEVLDPAALRASLDALPELRLKAAAIEHADAQAAVAKAAKQPDWGVDVGYSHRDPRFGDYLSAKLTMSLPIFGSTRQNPQIAARLEDVNSAVAEQRQTRRDLEAALASALADHVMHHERLEQARGTLVPLADRRARLEVASYAAGTASLADVLSAALGLAEAKVDLIGREADVTRDGARIALTYGSNPQ
jgi:outer membrane protein TolC